MLLHSLLLAGRQAQAVMVTNRVTYHACRQGEAAAAALRRMLKVKVISLAGRLLSDPKCCLTLSFFQLQASDESNATTGKRLESVGVENTEDNRRAWRQLLYTAPGAPPPPSFRCRFPFCCWYIVAALSAAGTEEGKGSASC